MRLFRDKRVTEKFISIKSYFLVLLVVILVNDLFALTYFVFIKRMKIEVPLIITYVFIYISLITLIISIIIGTARHYYFNRPMMMIGEAARKIAQGDFSARVPKFHKDSQKGYIDIMFDDFNKMAEELSSIETLKNDFIANVSHEIKTPLSVIQSYATAMQGNRLTEAERSEYAKTIVNASQRLSELVTNILKLSKLDNQEIAVESSSYDLSEQIRCCVLSFENLWEEKGIEIDVDLDDVMVKYDENMLEMVWNNLISNAVKFTEKGGFVSVKLRKDMGYAVVSVTDSGCGMDEGTKKHIFDKFYQGDTSHSQQGNGLGLALVKKVIEIVKGEIEVDSKEGDGTTFTVKLKI